MHDISSAATIFFSFHFVLNLADKRIQESPNISRNTILYGLLHENNNKTQEVPRKTLQNF